MIGGTAPGLGADTSLLEKQIEQLDHKTGEGLTFDHCGQLGLLMQGVRYLDGKTFHGNDPDGGLGRDAALHGL